MKTTKKWLGMAAIVAVLTAGFSIRANAYSETCTLDTNGTCECFGIVSNGQVVGYYCDRAESSPLVNKCVCN